MKENAVMPVSRCREILEIAASEAASHGVREVEILISAGSAALTRFASNGIHQNVAESERVVSIRTQQDHRTARASTNRLDADSLRAAVRETIAIMRAQPPDDRLLPMAEPLPLPQTDRSAAATASFGPADRAAAVRRAIAVAEQAGQTAAGILSIEDSVEALFNSRGVCAYHPATSACFSITVMGKDSSGWAKQRSPDIGSIPIRQLAETASRKAALSAHPRLLDPGRYTVILEPAAVLDLVGQMFGDFSGTAIEDQRSFLTGRLGEKLFGGNITVFDDVCHPLQSGAPFDGEGLPRGRLTLVEQGTVREVAWSRAAAARHGKDPTGHGFPLPNEVGEMPLNIVFAGGDSSVAEMVASTARGILVTRLWYIREVDPYQKRMTGMTRDGTFLVEDGEVRHGVRNFRFNQSLIDLLANVEALGPAVRASGEEAFDMVVPPMKVREFQFSEVTEF